MFLEQTFQGLYKLKLAVLSKYSWLTYRKFLKNLSADFKTKWWHLCNKFLELLEIAKVSENK